MLHDSFRRTQVRLALAELLGKRETPTPFALTDLFERELDDYAELIAGPAGAPAGFLTRGEGADFTERGQVALEQLGMPAEARAHHRELARRFEHRRSFLKIEWRQSPAGLQPLAACYFRRRPDIEPVLTALAARGVNASGLELAREVAGLLEKRTVHFVAAAFRPAQPIHHKLYFTQLAAPDTREEVAARLSRVFELFRIPARLRATWRAQHGPCLGAAESTVFLSVSLTAESPSPSFKLDYPAVPAERAAAWLSSGGRTAARADAERACRLANTASVSYLGVRFHPEAPSPALKYYCDVP